MSALPITALDFRVLQLADAKIRETIEARTQALAIGNQPDFAGYKNACGFIKGLIEALTIISDVNKAIFEERT